MQPVASDTLKNTTTAISRATDKYVWAFFEMQCI